MDRTCLKFLDEIFDNTTSFFTFMFIPNSQHEAVIEEIYRVLRPGGKFYIWDVKIPEFDESSGLNKDKTLYVVPLLVDLGNEKIDTSYGTNKWLYSNFSLTKLNNYFKVKIFLSFFIYPVLTV